MLKLVYRNQILVAILTFCLGTSFSLAAAGPVYDSAGEGAGHSLAYDASTETPPAKKPWVKKKTTRLAAVKAFIERNKRPLVIAGLIAGVVIGAFLLKENHGQKASSEALPPAAVPTSRPEEHPAFRGEAAAFGSAMASAGGTALEKTLMEAQQNGLLERPGVQRLVEALNTPSLEGGLAVAKDSGLLAAVSDVPQRLAEVSEESGLSQIALQFQQALTETMEQPQGEDAATPAEMGRVLGGHLQDFLSQLPKNAFYPGDL